MRKTITPEDLVRFIYRETTDAEELQIVEALAANPDLLHEYRSLVKAVTALDSALMEPDPTSVNIIMEYSAAHQKVS